MESLRSVIFLDESNRINLVMMSLFVLVVVLFPVLEIASKNLLSRFRLTSMITKTSQIL
jgi:hypothetical protein